MLSFTVFLTVECNGGLDDPRVVQESGADQEVPHAEVLPEQPPGEFDFNEFFNLEKTMPGLASVRYGEHCMLYYLGARHKLCGRGNIQNTFKVLWVLVNQSFLNLLF